MNDNNKIQSFGFIEEYENVSEKRDKGKKSFLAKSAKNINDSAFEQSFDFVAAPDGQEVSLDKGSFGGDAAIQSRSDAGFNRGVIGGNEVLTIGAFYERLHKAISKEFPQDIWIMGEVRKFRESKGHRYLELVDAAETVGNASDFSSPSSFSQRFSSKSSSFNDKVLDVVCWRSNWSAIESDLAQVGISLEEGRVVKVRGRVSVWEGAGRVRLAMNKLDIEALLGQIASQRLKLLRSLQERGIYDLNREKTVPLVPLKVGLVTSPGSEGHKDFVGVLERSGYNFQVFLQPSLVQGQEAARQISFALDQFDKQNIPVDIICVVRGGGSKSDLAVFDSEEAALAILRSPYPVWTGIGHTGDNAVVDMIANKGFATPTACAEALVSVVDGYYANFVFRFETLTKKVWDVINTSFVVLEKHKSNLEPVLLRNMERHERAYQDKVRELTEVCNRRLRENLLVLEGKKGVLTMSAKHCLVQKISEVENKKTLLHALDPKNQMSRGWSLVKGADGKVVKSVQKLAQADFLSVYLSDGSFEAEVKNIVSDN